jgi:hypothetical protein
LFCLIQITLQAKIIGQRGLALQPLLLEAPAPIQSLRQLLAAIVQQQIVEFLERKQAATFLRVLSQAQLEDGAEAGRILSGDPDRQHPAPDPQQSLQAVLTAFGDGLFYVFLDDVQLESLDEAIQLQASSHILFVRLIPLAGG